MKGIINYTEMFAGKSVEECFVTLWAQNNQEEMVELGLRRATINTINRAGVSFSRVKSWMWGGWGEVNRNLILVKGIGKKRCEEVVRILSERRLD